MTTRNKPYSSSDDHPAVQDFKQKLETLDTGASALQALNDRIDANASGEPGAGPKVINIGHWKITIHGEGAHHNRHATDANWLVAQFVRELRAAGHKVTLALITNGTQDNVTDAEDYLESLEKNP